MSGTRRKFICGALLLACVAFCQPRLVAGSVTTEAALIQMLHSSNPDRVKDALAQLPGAYPQSTNAVAVIRELLTDKAVRIKAARALGNYHAELPLDEVKIILGFLRSPEVAEAMDGLKALRGLKEPEAIQEKIAPDVAALLQDKEVHVVRDACRTLAVVGNKDSIPLIEPLLNNSRPDVRQDAKDAIAALNAKH